MTGDRLAAARRIHTRLSRLGVTCVHGIEDRPICEEAAGVTVAQPVADRCVCAHKWIDHTTWCYSSGCPCRFTAGVTVAQPAPDDALRAAARDAAAVMEDAVARQMCPYMAEYAAALRAALGDEP